MNGEEMLLVCGVFGVYWSEESRLMCEQVGLGDLVRVADGGWGSESFSARPQLLESVLVARLGVPNTRIFEYLAGVSARASSELASAFNQRQELQRVAQEAVELAQNYLGLALGTPELFEGADFRLSHDLFARAPLPPHPLAMRARLFVNLLTRFPSPEIQQTLLESFEDTNALTIAILQAFRAELSFHTVFSSEASDLLGALAQALCLPPIKRAVLVEAKRSFTLGSEYESSHVLGFLFALGPVPKSADPLSEQFRQAVYLKFKASRTRNVYRKLCENLSEVYRKYKHGLLGVLRTLMRNDLEDIACSEIVSEFLRAAIDSNSGRASLGYMYSAEAQRKSCSHPFAILLHDVLLELALPVATKPELLEKVELKSSAHLKELLPLSKPTFFGIDQTAEGLASPLSGAARFFFFALSGVGRFFVSALKHAEMVYRNIEKLKAEKKKLPRGSPQRLFLSQHCKRLKTEFTCFRLAVEDSERIQRYTVIYNALFQKILNSSVWIPEEFLIDYSELHGFFSNIIEKYVLHFPRDQFGLYIAVVQKLLSPEYAGASLHVKSKLTELLFVFNMTEKGRVISELRDTLDAPGLTRFLESVVGFFGSVDSGEANEMAQAKFKFRFFVTKFLVKALEQDDYRNAFIELKGSPQLQNFLGHLITDLNYFLETVFGNMEKLARPQPIAPPQDTLESSVNPESPDQIQGMTKSYLKFGRNYLKLFTKVSELTPSVCVSEAWVRRVATILNFYAFKLCTKNYASIKFVGVNELGFKPLDFIKELVLIYARLGYDQRFKEEIINDERSYSKEILIDIGSTAFKRELVSSDLLEKFEKLIEDLDTIKLERDSWNLIVENPPDEFVCQITAEIMTDPVQLPQSKSIVDKKAILEHLTLNGNYDPFNRTKLSITELIPLNDLRAKINAWIEQRKKEVVANKIKPEVSLRTQTLDDTLYGNSEKSEKKPEDDDELNMFKKLT